jgi:hypothetical protein
MTGRNSLKSLLSRTVSLVSACYFCGPINSRFFLQLGIGGGLMQELEHTRSKSLIRPIASYQNPLASMVPTTLTSDGTHGKPAYDPENV